MPKFREYHFHFPFYRVDSSTSLTRLYVLRFINDLIGKSVFLFLPIYVYTLGAELEVASQLNLSPLQAGMILFAVYLLGGRAVVALLSIWSAQLTARLGTRFSFFVSFLGKMVQILGFFLSGYSIWFLPVAMVGFGVSIAFFFNSYHYIFAQHMTRRHAGQDIGVVSFYIQLASVIAPMTAGIVIAVFGFETVFILGLTLCVLGLGVISQMKTTRSKSAPSWGEFLSWIKTKLFLQKSLSFAGRYFNDSVITLWPLYVFLVLGGVDRVGFLYSLSLFIALILTFLTGFYVDHRKKTNTPFFASGGMLSLLWLFRINLVNVWSIALVDTFEKLTSSVHWLLYDARYIGDGKGKLALAYFTYRELMISLFAMAFWLSLIVLFMFITSWTMLFVLAATGVLLSLLINDTHLGSRGIK